MSRILPALSKIVSATMAIGLWMCASQSSIAQNQVSLKPGIQTQKVETPVNGALKVSQAAPQLLTDKRAITVIGQGQATAPADTALMEFRFASRSPQPGATSSPPQDTPSLPGAAALKPVVDSLVAIKVPAENIGIESSTMENPKLLVKLNKPTRERMQEVVKVASSALGANDSLFVQGITAEYAVNNCQPLESAARRAAIKDAQTQLKAFAQEMGIELGELLLVTVYPIVSPSTVASCGTKVAASVSPLSQFSESSPPYNPSAPPEVLVRSQVGFTYAIKPQ